MGSRPPHGKGQLWSLSRDANFRKNPLTTCLAQVTSETVEELALQLFLSKHNFSVDMESTFNTINWVFQKKNTEFQKCL